MRRGGAVTPWGGVLTTDHERPVIAFAAGDKSGVNEKRFYRMLIAKADERFDRHLERLER